MKSGFTLIELLVVLVIVGIISAFIVPRFISPLENTRLKTATKKIAGALRYAGNTAATQKRAHVVLFDLKRNRLMAMPYGKYENSDIRLLTSGERVERLDEFDWPDSIALEREATTINQINPDLFIVYFYPNGSSSGGDIRLTSASGQQYSIHMDFITSIVEVKRVSA